MAKIAKAAGLGRESLYKALSPEGNPVLILALLGLPLSQSYAWPAAVRVDEFDFLFFGRKFFAEHRRAVPQLSLVVTERPMVYAHSRRGLTLNLRVGQKNESTRWQTLRRAKLCRHRNGGVTCAIGSASPGNGSGAPTELQFIRLSKPLTPLTRPTRPAQKR
jgi:hypothetical protein